MIHIDWTDSTLDGLEQGWCDRYLATIEKRKRAAERALLKHWAMDIGYGSGQVLENGFHGRQIRQPGVSPDSLLSPAQLADLLINRAQGFNLDLELVNLGPFPCSGND